MASSPHSGQIQLGAILLLIHGLPGLSLVVFLGRRFLLCGRRHCQALESAF
jgi:hypothetical protein